MLGPITRHKTGRSRYRMSQPEPLVWRFNITSLLRNRQANPPVKTCFSAVTGYPGARSRFLGRLACIAFVSGSTISLSLAGFRDGGVRGSGGSFVGPVQRIEFTASHGNVDAHNPYLSGYRGSLAAPNRETVGTGMVLLFRSKYCYLINAIVMSAPATK